MAESTPSPNPNFKFRGMKAFASQEWMADSKKKYRQVFEASQLQFMYAELSLYNKQFDREDWEINVTFCCNSLGFDGQFLNEIARLDVQQRVSRTEHIVYIRDGWGHSQKGAYWKNGTYAWVALVDGVVVGSTRFYVQAGGPVTAAHNPYFELQSLQLFEAPRDMPPLGKRVYATQFQASTARFIWGELMFQNQVRTHDWIAEFFFYFYNTARELKGLVPRLVVVRHDDPVFEVTGGWGTDSPDTWYEDKLTLEVVFLGHVVATVPFEIVDYSADAPAQEG